MMIQKLVLFACSLALCQAAARKLRSQLTMFKTCKGMRVKVIETEDSGYKENKWIKKGAIGTIKQARRGMWTVKLDKAVMTRNGKPRTIFCLKSFALKPQITPMRVKITKGLFKGKIGTVDDTEILALPDPDNTATGGACKPASWRVRVDGGVVGIMGDGLQPLLLTNDMRQVGIGATGRIMREHTNQPAVAASGITVGGKYTFNNKFSFHEGQEVEVMEIHADDNLVTVKHLKTGSMFRKISKTVLLQSSLVITVGGTYKLNKKLVIQARTYCEGEKVRAMEIHEGNTVTVKSCDGDTLHRLCKNYLSPLIDQDPTCNNQGRLRTGSVPQSPRNSIHQDPTCTIIKPQPRHPVQRTKKKRSSPSKISPAKQPKLPKGPTAKITANMPIKPSRRRNRVQVRKGGPGSPTLQKRSSTRTDGFSALNQPQRAAKTVKAAKLKREHNGANGAASMAKPQPAKPKVRAAARKTDQVVTAVLTEANDADTCNDDKIIDFKKPAAIKTTSPGAGVKCNSCDTILKGNAFQTCRGCGTYICWKWWGNECFERKLFNDGKKYKVCNECARKYNTLPKVKGKYTINEEYKKRMFEQGEEVEVIKIDGDDVTVSSPEVNGRKVKFCEVVSKACLSPLRRRRLPATGFQKLCEELVEPNVLTLH